MRIRFANWQPDLQGLTNAGQQDIKNVYPTGGGGYAPVRALSTISTNSLDAQTYGAFAAQDATGTTNTFAGDVSKLYRLNAGAFSDVSRSGGYTVSSTERWEFAQYGQRVIATEISDPVQYYDMGSSALFANLAGSPPQARHIAVVRDFVVLGNTTTSPTQLAWSGFNNSDQWTAGTNQSDTQTLQGGGWIQKIIGGEVGFIFQEHAITRMTYVGPPAIFQFDLVEQARGLVTPGAIATVGVMSFYRGQDGFYSFDPVNGSQQIGNSKVDNWFNSVLQGNTSSLITAAIDPSNKLAVFSFVSTDATDASHPDTLLFYNWVTKEWSYAKIAHDIIFSALSEGFTLESLSVVYPILENVPVSFDSRQWTGGQSYFGAFGTDHKLGTLAGATLGATMETSDQEPLPGARSIITNVMPLCDTSSASVIVRSRERFSDAVINTNSAAMQPNGDCPMLSSGRWHRAQLSIPAGVEWTYATGLDISASPDGEI